MHRISSLLVHPRRSWLVALVVACFGVFVIAGLGQAERTGGDASHPVGREQRLDFLQFARVVRGDDQRLGAEAASHATAFACAS